jgi:hypothetical protein
MQFKSQKLVVKSEDPFANDKLDRKPHIDNFSLLLENISTPIVLSVNAPWGQGKTTFLEMLHAQLQNQGNNAIYFSAWETDFASDPLLAFLGEMNQKIELLIDGDKGKSEAWEKTKKAGSHLLRKGIPALIKVGTAGVIDAEKMIEAESSKLMEGFSKDLIDEYTKNKSAISEFKEGVSKVLSNEDNPVTKLFVIVDELDRCRPTYAIELLERIKHLLDIEGLVFVLAMDKVQLAHSVKGVYGADFEALGYLRRFIDIEYTLPESSLDEFIEQLYNNFGFNDFFQKRTQYNDFKYDAEHLKSTFKLLANAKSLSLREVEQLFSKINLVIHSTPVNTYLYPALLAFLIIVKEYHLQSYNKFIVKGSTPEELIKLLYSMMPCKERLDSFPCMLIEGYLIGAKDGDSLKIHEDLIKDANTTREQLSYSNRVIDISNSFCGFNSSINLNGLKQRIELVESFNFDR